MATRMTTTPELNLYLGHPWYETTEELKAKEFPSKAGLEFGLRSNEPVPRNVRDFLADLVTGKEKAPRGRPRRNWLDRTLTSNHVLALYDFTAKLVHDDEEAGEHLGDKPSEIALIRTRDQLAADGDHRSLETVRDIVGERKGWDREAWLQG